MGQQGWGIELAALENAGQEMGLNEATPSIGIVWKGTSL